MDIDNIMVYDSFNWEESMIKLMIPIDNPVSTSKSNRLKELFKQGLIRDATTGYKDDIKIKYPFQLNSIITQWRKHEQTKN